MVEEEEENKDESKALHEKVKTSDGWPPAPLDQIVEKWRREQLPIILTGLEAIKKHPKLFEKDWKEEILGFSKRAKELQKKEEKISTNEFKEIIQMQNKTIEYLRKLLEKLDSLLQTTGDIQSGKISWRTLVRQTGFMVGGGVVGFLLALAFLS